MAIDIRDARIAVMGAGAVGSYFGGMFARAWSSRHADRAARRTWTRFEPAMGYSWIP